MRAGGVDDAGGTNVPQVSGDVKPLLWSEVWLSRHPAAASPEKPTSFRFPTQAGIRGIHRKPLKAIWKGEF